MSAPSLAVLDVFLRWKRAELAAYFAQPCPDPVMDELSEEAIEAARAIADVPAQNATDVLLKLLPLALILNEAPLGQPPLLPVNAPEEGTDYQEDALWRSIIADLGRACPILAEAVATPASGYAINMHADWSAPISRAQPIRSERSAA